MKHAIKLIPGSLVMPGDVIPPWGDATLFWIPKLVPGALGTMVVPPFTVVP